MNRWLLLRDIALTGTGIAVILTQVFAHSPSDVLLVTGLALTSPSIADHVKALLSSPGAHASSPSSPPPPSSPSSPPREASGEQPS